MHIFWRISSKNEKKGWSWKKMKSLFYEKPFIFTEKCKGEKVYDFFLKKFFITLRGNFHPSKNEGGKHAKPQTFC